MELQIDGPRRAKATVVLAHGAGAPMDSPFMQFFAEQLAARKLRVVRFEFPYMRQRRETGRQRPPDRQPILLDQWKAVLDQLNDKHVLIGGKSMGGRMASLIAEESAVRGLICLGYPFHPPGKLDRLRIDALRELSRPALILQGERDPFGTRNEVSAYPLSSTIELYWLPDGDHSFKPRKKSGRTEEQNWLEAVEAIDDFVQRVLS